MISKKMAKALNKQINAETYSAYLYFAMSSYVSVQSQAGWRSGVRPLYVEQLESCLAQ